jgi:hypothetical protein
MRPHEIEDPAAAPHLTVAMNERAGPRHGRLLAVLALLAAKWPWAP